MARIYADRVLETSTSTGTGTIALAGAVAGFRTFASVCAVNDTCDYAIVAVDANGAATGAWETGRGTYSAAGVLTRTTVQASTNANAAVNFAAGTKQVFLGENAASIVDLIALILANAGGDDPTTDPGYAAHRYWRILTASNNGDGYTGLQELYFLSVDGVEFPPVGGTPIASGSTGGAGIAAAFNRAGDNWQVDQNTNVWIGYVYPTAVKVRQVKLQASTTFAAQTPAVFGVQWSDDGVTWTTKWTVSSGSTGYSNNQVRVFVDPQLDPIDKTIPNPNGNQGKALLVKLDNTGLEWGDVSSSGGSGGSAGLRKTIYKSDQVALSNTAGQISAVPDMSVTFSLSKATNLRVALDGLLTRSAGSARFMVYVDGVRSVPPTNPDGNGLPGAYYSFKNNANTGGGEQFIQEYHLSHWLNLAAGQHTIAIYFSDSQSLASTTFLSRIMTVEDLDAAIISGGAGVSQESIIVALGDETTAVTSGAAKVTMRMPYAFTLTSVRASLTTASTSGIPTIDINKDGATILSTKLTIDQGEKTSTTAAVPVALSDVVLADDAEMTFDIDVAGTGAAGLKVVLIGHQ